MAVLRLFAAAREAAGTARDEIAGATVGDVLASACARYGDAFADVLATSRVWRNGEPAADGDPVTDADEVAVLPPVSGGAVEDHGGGGAGRPAPDHSADRELGGGGEWVAADANPARASAGWPASDRSADGQRGDGGGERAPSDRNPERAAADANPDRERGGDRNPEPRPANLERGGDGAGWVAEDRNPEPRTDRNAEPPAADRPATIRNPDRSAAGWPAPDRSADGQRGDGGGERATADRNPEPRAAKRERGDGGVGWAAEDRNSDPREAARNAEPHAADRPATTRNPDPPAATRPAVDRNPPRPAANGNPDRPHVRLGLLWAFATTVAAVLGAFVLAVWMAVAAALAAAQVARSWRRQPQQAEMAAAAAGAAIITLAAAVGPLGIVVGAVVAAAAAFLRAAPPVTPQRTLLVAGPIGLACAAPVVLRTEGFPHAYALLALVWAYDAGCYVVGTGAANRWEGPAAGIATVAAMALAVAVVFVPPFEGAWPWAFAVLVAALAPFAERAGSMLVGDRDAAVPVLRRIDSLLAAGPAFAALGLVVL